MVKIQKPQMYIIIYLFHENSLTVLYPRKKTKNLEAKLRGTTILVMRILVIKMSLQSQCFVSQMQLKASLVIICLCFTRSIISFSFFHQSSFFLPSQLLFEQIIIIPRDNVGNVFEYCDVTSFLLLSFFPFFNTVSVINIPFPV